MKQFSSPHFPVPSFPLFTHAKLRLRLMVQLRRTPREPSAAFRQRWRRWHRLHRLQPRFPGNFSPSFPGSLEENPPGGGPEGAFPVLQRGALQRRWFWRRGYGAQVLRRLRQRRHARRHLRWRKDFQKKRSQDRRQH